MTDDVAPRARERRPWREEAAHIAAHIRNGHTLDAACRKCNVSIRTVEAALLREDEYADPIQDARDDYEAQLRSHAFAHSESGSGGAMTQYLLERHNPKRYRLPKSVEVSGPDGAPVQTQAVTLALADAVTGARGEESG